MRDIVPQDPPNPQPRKDYYTYLLYRPDHEFPFYVGKGCRARIHAHERCARTSDSCTHLTCRVIRKVWRNGLQIKKVKVAEHLTEQEAFDLECLLIEQGREEGWPLVNQTDGGEGTSGYIPTAEWREHHSKQFIEIYANPQMREKHRKLTQDLWQTPEYRDKLLEIRKDPLLRARQSQSASRREPNRAGTFEGFVSPQGEVYSPVMNLHAFCEEHGLSYCGMWLVTQEKQGSHQGWTRYYPPGKVGPTFPPKKKVYPKGNTYHAKFYTGLVSPDGTIYTDIYNLKAFCKEHGLGPSNMCLVVQGKKAAHKGWTRYKPE